MENDPAQEWRRMQEVYSRMSDDELQNVADTAYDLTDIARQVLAAEISSRGLGIALIAEAPTDTERSVTATEKDLLDHELAGVYEAYSAMEARSATETLGAVGIAWRIGPDDLEYVEDYVGSYEDGVAIRVHRFDRGRAIAVLPERREEDPPPDSAETSITCPKCKSDGVIFDSVDQANRYNWHCEDCGNKWQDDGVETAG